MCKAGPSLHEGKLSGDMRTCKRTTRHSIAGIRSGKDGVEQQLGVGGVIFAETIEQVIIGRAQWEVAVAGVHHALDEGPDFGQGLMVGPSGEPAFAKVIANEAKPVFGQFAGRISFEGRGRGARERLFQPS